MTVKKNQNKTKPGESRAGYCYYTNLYNPSSGSSGIGVSKHYKVVFFQDYIRLL